MRQVLIEKERGIMSEAQMEKFLIKIGGLPRCSATGGAKSTLLSVKHFHVGDGWLYLMKDLIIELIGEGWNCEGMETKEKFGGLSVDINNSTSTQFDIMRKYESLSYETCEFCGKLGALRNDLGWWRTLCDNHYKAMKMIS